MSETHSDTPPPAAVAAPTTPSLDELRAAAAEAIADVRTIERRLLGLPVRGAVAARVDAVIARKGWR